MHASLMGSGFVSQVSDPISIIVYNLLIFGDLHCSFTKEARYRSMVPPSVHMSQFWKLSSCSVKWKRYRTSVASFLQRLMANYSIFYSPEISQIVAERTMRHPIAYFRAIRSIYWLQTLQRLTGGFGATGGLTVIVTVCRSSKL